MENNSSRKSYYDLVKHDMLQIIVFIMIFVSTSVTIFYQSLPILEYFFSEFLHGKVMYSGEKLTNMQDDKKDSPTKQTNYYSNWAIDFNTSKQESRYWFDPFLSVSLICAIFGLFITVIITTSLSRKIGYMRQKIEREIVNTLEKISIAKFGFHNEAELDDLIQEIMLAQLPELHGYVTEWNIPFEDIRAFHKVLIWQNSGFLYRLLHFNDGLRFYMRNYFTIKYNNSVLGFVYIGAAILIIIIGLRGLKFIPPTQPSLVIFALGLEFSLLVTYAVTLMYTRPEDESDSEQRTVMPNQDNMFLSGDFGNSKEIEKLLRVFIKSDKN